ncbi:hypothetical protein [Snuella sedimenti]|uniref:RING-type E3 ubiquitin transferase n=1 Tax=Snuella sedimenti TaxID=2798802 RepID=A0A8J7IFE6_9FLAO|nr:hypothetical protein [Snuella sedimenti]MBJ6366753.1 hypothetical protein [Snuella sedimenti]
MILMLESKGLVVSIMIAIVVLLMASAYYFNRKQRVLRRLSKFKPKKILQFRTNELTKLTGKVLHAHEPFVTPLSKRACVAYTIKIAQKKSSGKSSYWKTIVSQENIQDFFIEQQGEVVMVKPTKMPKNYDAYFVEDKRVSSGFFNDPTPEFQKVLEYYGVESTNFFGFNKTLRYTERILEVGEIITVGGIAKWKTLKAPMENLSYSKIAALESGPSQKLILTDLPQAKIISDEMKR